MARVFISHASEDSEFAEQVHGWLRDDCHEVFSNQDLRDGIGVGEDWEQRLYERLRWADAVVCVITTAYVNSPWCSAEVAIARSRGSRLLPVLAESRVTEHPLLETLQYADASQNGSAARLMLAEALRRVDRSGGLGWPDDRSPFPGLRPFDTDERMVFFGRGDEVARIAASLRSPAERADASALLVVGPSGCGKSSLVRAGLIPAMAAESDWLTLPAIMPGADPVAALVRVLAEGAQDAGLYWTVGEVRRQLTKEGFRSLVDELLVAASCQRLLVVIDQFEELLTQTPPAERIAFAKLLRTGVVAGLVHVVATLRPEFLEQVLLSPELAVLPTQTHTLRPLRREALRAVIEGPADLAGISVDSDLVTRLITDTDSGEALPLLAYALAELAEGVTRGGALLTSRYEQIGGVQGALTRQADAALANAVKTAGRTEDQVLADLLRLVTVDEEGRPTRLRVRRDELPQETAAELDGFIARRLLTTDVEDGHVIVGVAHEAFLSAWLPFANAIAAASSALRAGRAVEIAAADWAERDRPPDRLWEGGRVAAALADTGARFQGRRGTKTESDTVSGSARRAWPSWLRRDRVLVTDRVRLSRTAREFLQAGVRRDRRRRRRATTVLTLLLVVALAAAGGAFVQQRAAKVQQGVAQRQQRLATARQLVAQAESTRRSDPRTAVRLGLAALKIHPARDTELDLFETLTTTRYAGQLAGHESAIYEVAFAPDGLTMATGVGDGTLLWNMADRSRPRRIGKPLSGQPHGVFSIAFSPDGQILATASPGDWEGKGGTILLWDLSNPAKPRRIGEPLTPHRSGVSSIAFSNDGKTLATAGDGEGDQGAVMLWDLADPAKPRRIGDALTGHGSGVISLEFAPDGRTLVTAGVNADHEGIVFLWDLASLANPRLLGEPLTGHSQLVSSVAFAEDGQTLVSADFDGTVLLWNVADRAKPRILGERLTTPGVYSLAFARDGRTLAMASSDDTVLLWDLADRRKPRRLGEPLTGHRNGVLSLAFTPDGRTLATASPGEGEHGTVRLWDLSDRSMTRIGEPFVSDYGLPAVGFAPDGQTLAIADDGDGNGSNETVLLWDLTDRSKPRRLGEPLIGHSENVSSVAFGLGGHTLATASNDGMVLLWDLADQANPHRLVSPRAGEPSWEISVTFAPDGQTLAITSGGDEDDDGTVLLWDLADRANPHPLRELVGESGQMASIAFSLDGQTLAIAGDDGDDASVALWDLADRINPQRLGELIGHTSVVSMAFAPDGQTIATGSDLTDEGGDSSVILWDLADPVNPRRLGAPLTDDLQGQRSVAFAPRGHTLATSGEAKGNNAGGVTLFWDIADPANPRRLGEPLVDYEVATSVAFISGGRTLASVSENGALLWDLSNLLEIRNNPMARACTIAERGFHPEEWARYVPGLDYQDSCAS